MVSPFNSFVGLTRPGPGVDPSLPAALYPTGVRNFVRVFPTDDLEGAALALFARNRGRTRVFVLDDGEPGYGALQATAFETAARRLGLTVLGRESWDPQAKSYADIARRVAASGATAVYVGGLVDTNAGAVVRALRARLGRRVDLLGPSGLTPVSLLVKSSKRAALGMYLSLPGVVTEGLPPAGARWAKRFGETQSGVRGRTLGRVRGPGDGGPPRRHRALGRNASLRRPRALRDTRRRTACSGASGSTRTATSRRAR